MSVHIILFVGCKIAFIARKRIFRFFVVCFFNIGSNFFIFSFNGFFFDFFGFNLSLIRFKYYIVLSNGVFFDNMNGTASKWADFASDDLVIFVACNWKEVNIKFWRKNDLKWLKNYLCSFGDHPNDYYCNRHSRIYRKPICVLFHLVQRQEVHSWSFSAYGLLVSADWA